VLCQYYSTGLSFKFLNVSLQVSHLYSMHALWECINITLLCPTLLFILIFGYNLCDSAIYRHAEYKLAYSSVFTISVKSKRVTRSILASEIYSIIARVNIAYTISITLRIITNQLNLPIIPTIVYIDLYSLYKCLIKLRTTKEKHLIINIIVL
jgi:hypothetical protein